MVTSMVAAVTAVTIQTIWILLEYIYLYITSTPPPPHTHPEEGVGGFKEVLLIKDIDYSNDLLLSLSFSLSLYSSIGVFGRIRIYIIHFLKFVML